MIFDRSKDVLLAIYGNECKYCDMVFEDYEELAEELQEVENLLLCKGNRNRNELMIGNIEVKYDEEVPEFFLYPANAKD